ncbi:unnamed protein product, partial [Rotaria magnacalcarata]
MAPRWVPYDNYRDLIEDDIIIQPDDDLPVQPAPTIASPPTDWSVPIVILLIFFVMILAKILVDER